LATDARFKTPRSPCSASLESPVKTPLRPHLAGFSLRARRPSRLSCVSQPASRCKLLPQQGTGSASGPDQASLPRPPPYAPPPRCTISSTLDAARSKEPIPTLHRYSVWRILREIAEPVGRSRGPGRPWLWRLKAPAAEGHPPRQIEIIGEIATWPILPILQTMIRSASGTSRTTGLLFGLSVS
jgi:hypothetical protein